jgi:hypothetical protein
MSALGLVAAAAVVVLLILLARTWVGRRRSDVEVCVSEHEARENAAPLTTAIVSRSRDRRLDEPVHPAHRAAVAIHSSCREFPNATTPARGSVQLAPNRPRTYA